MMLSAIVYIGFGLSLAGALSVLVPLRFLGIRTRATGWLVLLAGLVVAGVALTRPADETTVASVRTRLDEFAPTYQFSEVNQIPVNATPERTFRAVMEVTPAEIPLYRSLVWIRRGGTKGSESILNAADDVSLITVATRTTFLKLAEDANREFVMGTVVIAPPGVRLPLGSESSSFKALVQPGFAKATMSFLVEPGQSGWCLLRTETRVYAIDPASRSTFARYWRIIRPGSELIRKMWLRAIKVRAEARAR
ncbi:MAG: hypothetical protein NT151_03120 [Acidobacteria bacterium]|nr:hypothetical protein [Acidobacteriota bacterium]